MLYGLHRRRKYRENWPGCSQYFDSGNELQKTGSRVLTRRDFGFSAQMLAALLTRAHGFSPLSLYATIG
jgi:hypothetical protein